MPLSKPARQLLQSLDDVRPVAREAFAAITDLAQAGAIQDEIVAARVARGEVRRGYKIGFTNRTIWARYGVHHPIWGPVYQHTVQLLNEPAGHIDANLFCEPRLEPEIVVALARVPDAATPQAVAASLAWVAHGYEIVQSAFEGWQFSGAESFAAQGLHGKLLVGPRFEPGAFGVALQDLPDMLANLKLQLHLVGQTDPIDSGIGANVLDGPLHAIAHLIRELGKAGRSLSAGDIITTGTITDAQPLTNGQQWQTRLQQAGPLQDLQITVGTAI